MSATDVSAMSTGAGPAIYARKSLGAYGFFLSIPTSQVPDVADQRTAAQRLEAEGVPTIWTNEVLGGKDALVQLAVLLAATEWVSFATGIANIWVRPAPTMHAAAAMLAQAFPGRFALGLGVGNPAQAQAVGLDFGRPRDTMRAYLERMEAPTTPAAPPGRYARLVGANGPAMLALARDDADGALPAMQPVAFTAQARQTLGPDCILVVMAALEMDVSSGQDLAEVLHEHRDAGADHVAFGLPMGTDFSTGLDRLEQAARQLRESLH